MMENDHKVLVYEGTILDVIKIYGSYKRDFPAAERKDLHQLKQLFDTGSYRLLLLKEKSFHVQIGYAFVFLQKVINTIWLDYFAIEPPFRNEGYGTEFIQKIVNYYENIKGLFIESEIPDEASENYSNEKRRILFYERVGAKILKLDYYFPYKSGLPMYLLFKPNNGTTFLEKETIMKSVTLTYDFIHSDVPDRNTVLRKFVNTITDQQV